MIFHALTFARCRESLKTRGRSRGLQHFMRILFNQTRPRGYSTFSYSTQLSMYLLLLKKTKVQTNKKCIALSFSDVVFKINHANNC